MLQALTVWIVLLPLYDLVVGPSLRPFNLLSLCALLLWALGLSVETVADIQKFVFKIRYPAGPWPDSGLWHLSRHPNYFGEMLVWWGFFLFVLPTTWPLRILALLGPLFLSLMLRFVSGVPLLEQSAARKYGQMQAYHDYRARTRLLLPLPRPSRGHRCPWQNRREGAASGGVGDEGDQ